MHLFGQNKIKKKKKNIRLKNDCKRDYRQWNGNDIWPPPKLPMYVYTYYIRIDILHCDVACKKIKGTTVLVEVSSARRRAGRGQQSDGLLGVGRRVSEGRSGGGYTAAEPPGSSAKPKTYARHTVAERHAVRTFYPPNRTLTHLRY